MELSLDVIGENKVKSPLKEKIVSLNTDLVGVEGNYVEETF